MVGLAIDEAAEVENHTLGVVSLTRDCGVCVLKGRDFLLVALSLTLQLFSNLLLEDKSLESIVALFLGARETEGKTSSIILLLVDETGKSTVLALVAFDFDLELGSLLRELLSKGLEFEELGKNVSDGFGQIK